MKAAELAYQTAETGPQGVAQGVVHEDKVVFNLPVDVYQVGVLGGKVLHGDGTRSKLDAFAFAGPDKRQLDTMLQSPTAAQL